jgi:hypothetical protein
MPDKAVSPSLVGTFIYTDAPAVRTMWKPGCRDRCPVGFGSDSLVSMAPRQGLPGDQPQARKQPLRRVGADRPFLFAHDAVGEPLPRCEPRYQHYARRDHHHGGGVPPAVLPGPDKSESQRQQA